MQIKIICTNCGEELEIERGDVSFLDEVKIKVYRCTNKKCKAEHCEECEDLKKKGEEIKVLEKRIADANLVLIPIKRKIKVIEETEDTDANE